MFTASPSISAREAAAALGVSERTVRRWVARGDLPATKVGRSFAIDLGQARAVKDAARGVRFVQTRDELMELRGRYQELRDRVRQLEDELAEERRRTGRLEGLLLKSAA